MMAENDDYGLVVYEFEKNDREVIRIGLNEFRGHEYVDLRVFYAKDGEYHPSKKGLTMPKDLYPALLDGIVELGKALGFDELVGED